MLCSWSDVTFCTNNKLHNHTTTWSDTKWNEQLPLSFYQILFFLKVQCNNLGNESFCFLDMSEIKHLNSVTPELGITTGKLHQQHKLQIKTVFFFSCLDMMNHDPCRKGSAVGRTTKQSPDSFGLIWSQTSGGFTERLLQVLVQKLVESL